MWNAVAKAQRETVAQKERHAAAVRAAKRAAEKDPTKESTIAEAEKARDAASVAALTERVELDLPPVTVGGKLTRSNHVLMCQHQKAAARKAAAEAACRDAILKMETAELNFKELPFSWRAPWEKELANNRWLATCHAAMDALGVWEAADDECLAAHDRYIEALEAESAQAELELTEARAYRQRVMEAAANDAIARHFGYHES